MHIEPASKHYFTTFAIGSSPSSADPTGYHYCYYGKQSELPRVKMPEPPPQPPPE
jgi:hypothetical protein